VSVLDRVRNGPRWLVAPAAGLVAIALLLLLANSISQFQDFQLSEVAAYVVTVAGLSLLAGDSGQVSLGQGALMMVGAYAAALLILHTGLPLVVVLLGATAAGAAAGGLLGVVAARLRGPYLAGATLAFAVALPEIPKAHANLGGDEGLIINPLLPPSWMGPNATPERWTAFICVVAAVIALVLVANLGRSKFGRNFRAVRDDEIAASLSGIPVARTQILAFVVSAALAGLGGSLLALVIQTIGPNGFTLALSIQLLVAMVIGGEGSLAGATIGAVLIVFLPGWATDLATDLGMSAQNGANMALALFGAVLIVVILVLPGGIVGGARRLWAFVRRWYADRQTVVLQRVDTTPGDPVDRPGALTKGSGGSRDQTRT
jgi:branched-chain amino acid transport system permease protein